MRMESHSTSQSSSPLLQQQGGNSQFSQQNNSPPSSRVAQQLDNSIDGLTGLVGGGMGGGGPGSTTSCPTSTGVGGGASSGAGSGSSGTYHFKILVPSVAAGAIIGKGGETIAQLQKDCGARVKMSKSNDFYPGTAERVCLITGSVDGIMRIHNFVMDKIKEKPDPNARVAIDFDHKQTAEREKQVKILVPSSTAGMIIGKGGAYIKQIKEDSGAYVQLSQKSRDHALAERSITIIGDMEHNRKAVHLVLAKIVEDPQSGSCLNVSYADIQGPVANFNPTGSPYANPGNMLQHSPPGSGGGVALNSNVSGPGGGSAYSMGASNNGSNNMSHGGSGGTGNSSQQMHHPHHHHHSHHQYAAALAAGGYPGIATQNALASQQSIESLKIILRNNGFAEQATTEILGAFTVLANYGLLGPNMAGQLLNGQPGSGTSSTTGHHAGSTAPGTTGTAQHPHHHPHHQVYPSSAAAAAAAAAALVDSSLFGPIGSLSNTPTTVTTGGGRQPGGGIDGSHHQYDPFGSRRQVGAATGAAASNSPTLGSPPPQAAAQTHAATVAAVAAAAAAAAAGQNAAAVAAATAAQQAQIINNNSFGLGTTSGGLRKSPTPGGGTDLVSAGQKTAGGIDALQREIEVGENIVGAILGPGGKSLVEIQRASGASIQISKKGIFAPGTRNRIVTITGSPQAVSTAQYLIQEHVAGEGSKRCQQNVMAAVLR